MGSEGKAEMLKPDGGSQDHGTTDDRGTDDKRIEPQRTTKERHSSGKETTDHWTMDIGPNAEMLEATNLVDRERGQRRGL
jgi:hypothetical protein